MKSLFSLRWPASLAAARSACVAVCAALCATVGSGAAAADLKVGLSVSLSGPNSSLGVPYARGMQAALARLNAGWAATGRPTLAMGVAINTGPAFVGNMGSARRKKYSVLGDTVNTVARIEALNRDLGTSILVSAATLARVKDRVDARDRGRVSLKGKAEPVAIYELEAPP